MSNLTSVPIVDKNGKQTTVRKRLDAQRDSKPLNAPAPSITPKSEVSGPSRTPLAETPTLSEDQYKEFREWQDKHLNSVRYRIEVKDTDNQRFAPSVEALAWRVIQEGDVPEETVSKFISTFQTRRSSFYAQTFKHEQDKLLSTLSNSLLLAEKISKDAPQAPDQVGGPKNYASFIEKALSGYRYRPKHADPLPNEPIRTEEELASVAAVTRFILDARDRSDYGSFRDNEFKDIDGKKAKGSYMANRSLDAFLRESPHEIDRALGYIRSRGIGNTAKDTKQLVRHLKESEDMSVLSDGWL